MVKDEEDSRGLQTTNLKILDLKGHSQLWDHTEVDTSFLTLKKVHPNLKSIKVHLEIRFNFRSVLLDFQSFSGETCF